MLPVPFGCENCDTGFDASYPPRFVKASRPRRGVGLARVDLAMHPLCNSARKELEDFSHLAGDDQRAGGSP